MNGFTVAPDELVEAADELRDVSGARIYFRNAAGTIEVVAKSTRENQDRVIALVRELYG